MLEPHVLEEEQPSARPQYPSDLGERARRIVDRTEHEGRERRIHGRRLE